MSAPSGKPSPEGTRSSGVVEAMAIEDADTDKTAEDVPVGSGTQTPSERSRSDKREVNTLMSRGATLPQPDTTRFSHRGYDFHASREGMPASSAHMHLNHTEVHHHETSEVHNTMNLQQVQHNEMHVNTHNPAIAHMVEQVAEARSSWGSGEYRARGSDDGIRDEPQVSSRGRSCKCPDASVDETCRESWKPIPWGTCTTRRSVKMVLDGNARQSNATKDQQI